MIGALVQAVCDAAEAGISPLGVDWSVRYSRRSHTVKLAVYVMDDAPVEVVGHSWHVEAHGSPEQTQRRVRAGMGILLPKVGRKVCALRAAS